MKNHFIPVSGIRTHYLEAGQIGCPILILLHSGEYGGSAELSWEHCMPQLSRQFHVIAPDWLGFGHTEKLYDFAAPRDRALGHIRDFTQAILGKYGASSADFMGNSMGGSNLLRMVAAQPRLLPARSIIIAVGGGFAPMTAERKTLLSYDKSQESMRAMLRAMFHDPAWSEDEGYVERRQHYALMPGAWEYASAPRLVTCDPATAPASFGKPDDIHYEAIDIPALIVAGAEDRLREKGYERDIARRLPDSEVHVFEACGHCPNIEQPDRLCELTTDFLTRVHQRHPDLRTA